MQKWEKAIAIKELRRLLKPRTYIIKIWDCWYVKIEAAWECGVDISITNVDRLVISLKQGKRITTIGEMQADLVQFKIDIDKICNISDTLAKRTGEDNLRYFEKLLEIAEE